MTQEKMKQDVIDWAADVSLAVEAAAKDIKFQMKKSTVEADLKEAKYSAKKLIEKIDEYLESQKAEFKVGDYVIESSGNVISKIEEETDGMFRGLYYRRSVNFFSTKKCIICCDDIKRHATPEEIAEYDAALNFHKHGRKPFEVRIGDLICNKSDGKNFIVKGDTIFLRKQDFIDGKFVVLKTYKEVNEWLGVADE